jgi:hypothetical protein
LRIRIIAQAQRRGPRAIAKGKRPRTPREWQDHILTREHRTRSDQPRGLIRNHRWSLTALGELAGLDKGALSRFMKGTRSPTLETVDRIARVMKHRLISDAKRDPLYQMILRGDRRKKGVKKDEEKGT